MNSRGFTLIEMIVVTAILAVLAAILLAILDPISQIKKANDARRKSNLAQIQRALEAYYQDQGKYPAVSADYRIVGASGTIAWGQQWSPYMNIVPADPTSPKRYYRYTVNNTINGTGQAYRLYANLERGGKDPQACNTAGTACTSVPQEGGVPVKCGSGANDHCNFGVSSSNVSP